VPGERLGWISSQTTATAGCSNHNNPGTGYLPLYLLHQELGNRAILKLTEFGFPVSLSLVTGFVLCVAPSIFTSLKIEPPLRKMILRQGLSDSA